jgi:serine/threonine protein kinase
MSEPAEHGTQEQTPADVARMLTPAPAAPFAPGDPLPNLEMWVLVRKLGGGGFGEVWLARHERKGEAAVKFCTDPKARHKLVTHERTVVARVMKHGGNHPNVVPLLECNLSGEIPWLMYEYVDGGTLAEAVAEWRDLPPPRRLGRAVRTLYALTGALSTFHRLDPPLVHRDLKPQNILMAGSTPRITDFGIGGAALEAHGSKPDEGSDLAVPVPTLLQTAGSSRYAPPEQMFGSAPDPRDDVYALGVIAYQLVLADLKALPGPDVADELRALRIPAELVSLIVKSVALDPQRRPKDATAWDTKLAELVRKKTASSGIRPALPPDPSKDEPTEELEVLSESEITASAVTQTLDVAARGRWYSRPAGQPGAEWVLVATTPCAVKVVPGEVYRFSINSAATEADAKAVAALAGLGSLRYLNLSYCAAITDKVLAKLPDFPGLRQLFLRGCANVTDAGLRHLHALTALLTLELSDCAQLTPAAMNALQKAIPRCKIQR